MIGRKGTVSVVHNVLVSSSNGTRLMAKRLASSPSSSLCIPRFSRIVGGSIMGHANSNAYPSLSSSLLFSTAANADPQLQECRTTTTTTTEITDYSPYLTGLSLNRQPSAIRKLMPLLSQEGMVSLGGGLPNPDLFPIHSLQFGISNGEGDDAMPPQQLLELSTEELREALQYSPTPGIPRLIDQLWMLQKREHFRDNDENKYDVTVTVGSQDGLTRVFEMLLDPHNAGDDELFVENPTYSGALAFLRPFFFCGGKKNLIPIETDEHGLIPDSLERALIESSSSTLKNTKENNKKKKKRRVLYTIPTAQNPSGSTLSNARRQRIYTLAQEYDLIIMEDDPYYFLHPHRHSITSFLSLDTDGRVIRFDSMSKLLSSGMRIGFVTGPKPFMERLNLHIQATNLHNSGISQMMVYKILQHWLVSSLSAGDGTTNENNNDDDDVVVRMDGFEEHTRRVSNFYCQRRNVLLEAAERHMLHEVADWTTPEAGMFLWLKLRNIRDTKTLIEEKAAKANVLFVPGQAFDPLDRPSSFVRASFSTASDEEMDIAMERLVRLVRDEWRGS